MAFSKYMPQMGWQPIIISAAETVRYEKDYSTLADVPPDITVHRVGHRESSSVMHYARMKLKIAADFPDVFKTWYSPAYEVAKRILRDEKIDLIYNASPNFTAATVALRLKKEFNLPWVADFNDGWAVNDFLLKSYENQIITPLRQFQTRRIRRTEFEILTSATKVVTVHPHVKKRWMDLHGIAGDNIDIITEGYDEEIFSNLKPRNLSNGRLTITFLGTYYEHFLDTIRHFLINLYEIAREAEVFFIGRNVMEIQKMGMPNAVCMLNIPRKKSLEYALGSDFVYVVMPFFAKWTPAKTYDYLRLGKPILSSVPGDGDAAEHIRNANAGFVLSFEKEEMKKQLTDILDRFKKGEFRNFKPDETVVRTFERKIITKKMVAIFDSLVTKK